MYFNPGGPRSSSSLTQSRRFGWAEHIPNPNFQSEQGEGKFSPGFLQGWLAGLCPYGLPRGPLSLSPRWLACWFGTCPDSAVECPRSGGSGDDAGVELLLGGVRLV